MKNDKDRVLYVAKATFKFGKLGLDIIRQYFQHVIVIPFDANKDEHEKLTQVRNKMASLEYDYLISFWSDLYITKEALQRAKKGAINIHPAPPEHPGLGMFSFVRLFSEKRSHHGVTLHEMDEKFDHGKIYRCVRFPVGDLSDMDFINYTGDLTLEMLEEACKTLASGKKTSELLDINCVSEKWSETFYTAKMEQQWLSGLSAQDPIRKLDCSYSDVAILYNECGAKCDSIVESV